VRIGIDIRVANPVEPGQQRYLWRLGAWLGATGHDVHLLTVRRQPEGLDVPPGTSLHGLASANAEELRRRVSELELDVLLLNPERSRRYRGIPANVLRAAYGTEHYRQKLRSFRHPAEHALRRAVRWAPWEIVERHWERGFYERASTPPSVIAQSEYMRGEVLNSYAIPPECVQVIHNAIDTDEYHPEARLALRAEMRSRWSIPEDALCLLFLGHNFRLKGLWQLLDVLAGQRPDVHLLVAGRGTGSGQRRHAAARVEALGLQDRVTFAGPVRPSLQALAAADALVHLSWHDSFGFVALEAMACGLPVVTTPWVGASELIEDGVSGLVVDPADDAQIARAISALRGDGLRTALGDAAAAIGARQDEPSNFRRVLDVMRTAAERRGGPIRG